MKSERRHELQENELADWLENAVNAVAPHAKTILVGVVGAIVLFLAYTLWQNRATAASQAAWDQFYAAAQADDAEAEMLKLADAHPDDAPGLWARLFAADSQLGLGMQDLFTNRAAARPKLKDAAKNYRQVAETASGKYDAMVERALYGEAKAYEALGEKSDLDEAQKLYQQVIEQFPGGALAADAERRVAELKKPSTREFYDWFVTTTPTPPPTTTPPGIGPSFDSSNLPTPPLGGTETENTSVAPNLDPFKQGGQTTPPAPEPVLPTDSGVPTGDGAGGADDAAP